jgi:hypothetical protein
MDEVYRTLVPENEIAIWPRRLTAPPGEALEFSMVAIAETIVKIYAPETAPHVKSIDQRCREAPFKYKMNDQDIEEKFIILYLQLIENHFLGETLPEDDRLAEIFYEKLPRNTNMAKLYVASTKAELDGGSDTVEKAVLRVKKLLAVVRQAIRLASSYGPEEYVFRIESKDKEVSSSPSTHQNNQNRSSNDTTNSQNDKRSANDVTAATPAMVAYCECCGGWGHDKPFCKWAKTHAGTNIWRLVGADKFMTNKIVPGYEIVMKDDGKLLGNDHNAHNPPNETQKTSVNKPKTI